MVKVDAKDILNRLRDRDDRVRKSIYVSESIYKEFEKACKNVKLSRVLEDLMIQFVESSKKTSD